MNESAKKIKELRSAFKSEKMKEQHEARREMEKSFGREIQDAKSYPAKPVYVDDHDLKGFTDIEKAVIEAYYENRDQNHQQLAKSFGIARQTVTALFNSAQFKALAVKYYEFVMPSKLRLATEKLVDAGHEKTILRLNEHYGIIKAEKMDLNVTNKPIEDPEALQLLKELGEKMRKKDQESDDQ